MILFKEISVNGFPLLITLLCLSVSLRMKPRDLTKASNTPYNTAPMIFLFTACYFSNVISSCLGHLYLLLPLSGMLFPEINMVCFLTSIKFLFKATFLVKLSLTLWKTANLSPSSCSTLLLSRSVQYLFFTYYTLSFILFAVYLPQSRRGKLPKGGVLSAVPCCIPGT